MTTLARVPNDSENSSCSSCQSSCVGPIYTGGSTRGNSKRGKSPAIGPEVKLDFVLPERRKNLKRGGKRGQTSPFPVPLNGSVRLFLLFVSRGPVVESANLFV